MARQTTLNVSLTAPLRDFVQAKVDSGRYESASEVIRDGLRALQEREQAVAAFWTDVRAKVAEAREQAEAGEVFDGASAMDQILAELDADEHPRPAKRRKRSR